MATEYLGIDVGGTNVKMGIVEAQTGKLSNFYSHDTASWRTSGHFVERLGDAIAIQLAENKSVEKCGIGVPGLINRSRTTLVEITAIPEIDGTPIIPYLKERFPKCDFFLENDANAAALGEYYFGEDEEMKPPMTADFKPLKTEKYNVTSLFFFCCKQKPASKWFDSK